MEELLSFIPITISDIILLVTAVIVWVYTRAAQKANELQTSPAIILSFEDTTAPGTSSSNGIVRIKNIGRGPAYDIEFYPIALNEAPRGLFTYTFHLDDRVLESGQEKELEMWVATPDGGVEASDMMRFLFRLLPHNLHNEIHEKIQAETPALFVANYKGLNGRYHHSIYRLYSVLPPVGDIVMQLLHHGRGKRGVVWARWYHLIRPKLAHEGNRQPPQISLITKFYVFLYKNRK